MKNLIIVAILASGISLLTTGCEPEIVGPVDQDDSDSTYFDSDNGYGDSTIVVDDNDNDSTWVDNTPTDSTETGIDGNTPIDTDSTDFGG